MTREEKKVNEFNQRYKVGTPVSVDFSGMTVITKTAGVAFINPGDNYAWIAVMNINQPEDVPLRKVTPRNKNKK